MSGTPRIIRRKSLRAAMLHATSALALGLGGLLLVHGSALANTPAWDCRTGPDGRSWQCFKDGELVQDPVAPPAAAPAGVSPLQPPAVQQPLQLETPIPGADGEADTSTPPARPAAKPAAAAGPVAPAVTAKTAPKTSPAPAEPPAEFRLPAPPPAAVEPVIEAAPVSRIPPPAAATVVPEPIAPAAPLTPSPAAQRAAAQAFDAGPMPDLLAPSEPAMQQPVAPAPPARPQVDDSAAATALSVPTPASMGGDIDAGIDWGTCQQAPARTPSLTRTGVGPGAAPITVSADSAVADLDPQQATFSGNVQLTQGELHMQADELILNRGSGEVNASGGVLLRHPEVRIAGSAASYQLASGQGQIEQASYRIPAVRARGDAEYAELLGEGRSQYRNITYTTCRPGDADWLLRADALELDQVEGLGTARHASLRFLGVPILYAPVFTFPIDDRRRSGLLVPSIGQSDETGFDLSVPYYLNLAENYDLTLTPRLMTKRGLMLGGEFRFLTESTSGTLAADYLPNDHEYSGDSDARGSASLLARSRFNARTEADVRLNYVSDNDYLAELGGDLAAASTTHLERTGELRYHGNTWEALGRAQYYQTIDDSILLTDRPYSRLPQLLIEVENPDGISGTTYHLAAEYANFYRKDSVRGHRVDLFPAISLPMRKTWGFVEPKLGARYTAYKLTDQTTGLDDSPSRLTGMFSLDSGLYFDRSASFFGSAATHTLEPRLYYLYVPHGSQNDQPIFDTAMLDFNFDNLFRENRFNGADRFGDANQVTLALTSRMIADASGAELLRASVGQIIYFEDREVTLPGESFADDSTSAVVAELAAQLGGGWQTRAGVQWDPNDGSNGTIDQGLAQLSYRDDRRRVFNAAYRLRDGITQQTDLAAFWPLSEQFSLVGRHNYSLRDGRLLEALAGIEYGRCCWRIRALLRKYANSSDDDDNLAFMIQLELNGLGRLGGDIDQTLERGVYGYRTEN